MNNLQKNICRYCRHFGVIKRVKKGHYYECDKYGSDVFETKQCSKFQSIMGKVIKTGRGK